MTHREAFLQALAENEDDTTTRLVYADWLEERGEAEEADRQRKWPAAKAWLVRFCESLDRQPDEDDPDEDHTESSSGHSFKRLLNLAREALDEADEGGIEFYCGSDYGLTEALRDHCREFWKNWSIVTGVPLPPDVEEKSHFHCAC